MHKHYTLFAFLIGAMMIFSTSSQAQRNQNEDYQKSFDFLANTGAEYSPDIVPVLAPSSARAPFDVEFFFNLPDSIGAGTSAGTFTGVAFINNEYWISNWNLDSMWILDSAGGLITSLVIPGVANVRSITSDGTNLYMGAAGSDIFVIDPVARTLTSTITIAAGNVGARMCAYDPNADSGNGGFWIGNFTSDIQLISMTGAILTTIPSGTHGFLGIYGGAVDTANPFGPYLCVYHQGPPSNNSIGWLNIATTTPEPFIYDVNSVVTVGTGIAGGLFVSHDVIPNQGTFLAVTQGLEMTAIEMPDSIPFIAPPPPPEPRVFYDWEDVNAGTSGLFPNGWIGSSTGPFIWQSNAGPTGSLDTGPTVDNTLGTAAGIYVYTEATGSAPGDVATLETRSFIPVDTFTDPELSFWYHMYGADMGDLIISLDDGTGFVDIDTIVGQQQTSDTDPWLKWFTSIAGFDSVSIRFTGVRGPGFTSDMAIDDVRIANFPAITDFNLTSPADGALVDIVGPTTTQVVIDWEDATVVGGGTVNYVFYLDSVGGDFSTPLFSIASDNGGADSQLTLTNGQIEALLISLGNSTGDTADYIWQVEAETLGGVVSKFALSEFDISFILGVVALDNSLVASDLSVFPNPSEGYLTVEVRNQDIEVITIHNAIGQEVFRDEWNGTGNKTYSLSELNSGLYFLTFSNSDSALTKKLIIK